MGRKQSDVEGVLVLDKPRGPTSHDMVARVRGALKQRRVGHGGTLDPFATGVLVCCVGRATRLVRYFSGCDKTYEGVIRFGYATDTGDSDGQPLAEPCPVDIAESALAEAVRKLTGVIDQVPPMYSAKRVDGKRLHELARKGETIERKPVAVTVSNWQLGDLDGDRLGFTVTCSAGTYVRVLAEDIGHLVGCPAHLHTLRRIKAGPFDLSTALATERPTPEEAFSALRPIAEIPLPLGRTRLVDPDALSAFAHGREIPASAHEILSPPPPSAAHEMAVEDPEGGLAGVALLNEEAGDLSPRIVLVQP